MTAPGDATPATFREVLASGEFRALLFSRILSLAGDQIAKLAIAVMVYRASRSAFLAAATFAATFLPWLVTGPLLSGLGDRFRRRDVMVACDLTRAVMVACLAVPGLPLPLLFTVLVGVVVLAAPFEAARAALVTEVLTGDAYVVGSSLGQVVGQAMQAVGYAVGGAVVALVDVPGALLGDAGTFVASALLLLSVRRGATGSAERTRPRPVADLTEGARVVFGDPVLRTMVVVAWVTAMFGVVPEGLAVAVSAEMGRGSGAAGVLAAAVPAGALVGSFLIGRFVRPAVRLALVRPLAVLVAAPYLAIAFHPSLVVLALTWALAGIGFALNVPALATFMTRTPGVLRARAFGLAESGLQAAQGLALLVGGALATVFAPATVVAAAGAAGVVAAGVLVWCWPAVLRRGAPLPEPLVLTPRVIDLDRRTATV